MDFLFGALVPKKKLLMNKPTFRALLKPTWGTRETYLQRSKQIWGTRAWGVMVLGQSDQHPIIFKMEKCDIQTGLIY